MGFETTFECMFLEIHDFQIQNIYLLFFENSYIAIQAILFGFLTALW